MRRALPWIVAFALTIVAGGGTIVGLNATVFGPGDFVRVYLEALARGDAQSAIDLPGVDAADSDDLLLDDDALSGLTGIRQLSDEDLGAGRHRVTFAWSAPAGDGTTTFESAREGTRLGLFPEWGFAESPVAHVTLDVLHDPRFTANGADESTGQDAAGPVAYAVLVPGSYVFGHSTTFLRADSVTVLADEVGAELEATVDVEPGPAFASTLADEVHEHLTECTTQTVLFPTGCPFGHQINDRIVSDPVWSMVVFPELTIAPGEEFGTWTAGPAGGTAHLTVDVKSLFDGTVTTFDQHVVVRVSYTCTIDGDTLQITED
jgi:hypothetical protein